MAPNYFFKSQSMKTRSSKKPNGVIFKYIQLFVGFLQRRGPLWAVSEGRVGLLHRSKHDSFLRLRHSIWKNLMCLWGFLGKKGTLRVYNCSSPYGSMPPMRRPARPQDSESALGLQGWCSHRLCTSWSPSKKASRCDCRTEPGTGVGRGLAPLYSLVEKGNRANLRQVNIMARENEMMVLLSPIIFRLKPIFLISGVIATWKVRVLFCFLLFANNFISNHSLVCAFSNSISRVRHWGQSSNTEEVGCGQRGGGGWWTARARRRQPEQVNYENNRQCKTRQSTSKQVRS